MAPTLQAKLLRVLQEQEFERVGGTPHRSTSTSASSPPPTGTWKRRSATGGFRQDLYYRLNVVSLTLPPLRERREDIPVLAGYFVARLSGEGKQESDRAHPARRGSACWRTTGPATCASWRTRSSERWFWARPT